MRVVNRHLKTIEFDRVTQPVFLTKYMDEICTWNTDQQRIMEKSTIPLEAVHEPDSWSQWAKQNIPQESWSV